MRQVVNNEVEWHALRSQCVTASEASVLIGMDPYGSPGKLKKESDFKGNASTIVGQVLEPVVVDVTNRVLGSSFMLFEANKGEKVFYTRGRLGATPDAHDGTMLLECKSTRPDLYLKYAENPPTKYLVQLMVQLWCTDMKEGYLSILSTDLSQKYTNLEPDWNLALYKVKRNDALCKIIEEEAERFYKEEKFRVNSAIKRKCAIMVHMCYEKVNYKTTEVKQEEKQRSNTKLLEYLKGEK